jgi:phosphatidylglycerol:prolipoprotein diacylglycerol transferase
VYRKTKIEGMGFWAFIGSYGIFRIFIEFFREPDKIDLYRHGLFLGFITMGMLLSSLMVISAVIGMLYLYKKQKKLPGVTE